MGCAFQPNGKMQTSFWFLIAPVCKVEDGAVLLVKIKNVSHVRRTSSPKFSNVMCKCTVGILLAKEREMVDGYNCKMLGSVYLFSWMMGLAFPYPTSTNQIFLLAPLRRRAGLSDLVLL